MVQRLIVPIDGSDASWNGVDVALCLARRTDAEIEVVTVESEPESLGAARRLLDEGLAWRDLQDVPVSYKALLSHDSVAAALEVRLDEHPESTIVMASHGRGRSAAIVGSVTDDVLRRTFGPVVIVGPDAQSSDFDGPLVVTVDGSEESESALSLAGAWAIELGVEPWVVHVSAPEAQIAGGPDVSSAAYVARLAHDLTILSGREVQYDELHGSHPATAVADFARQLGASLVVASSHGRSGLSRLTMGSVTSSFVQRAPCPVLVVRLPQRPDGDDDRSWAR
jgi:nucleotide-binding universal stress UspA family protein